MKIKNIISTIFLLIFIGVQVSFAQCFKHRHSTNWFDAWVSCETAPNPNSVHGNSHWILFDLGAIFELQRTHFWNYNDVNNLQNGIQSARVDFSMDGINWTAGPVINLAAADGSKIYSGESGPDFANQQARYILLTGITNYGGDCMALSEVRFEANEANVAVDETESGSKNTCLIVNVFPNPIKSDTRIYLQSNCDEKVESYILFDAQGKTLRHQNLQNPIGLEGFLELSMQQIPAGEYILEVRTANNRVQKNLIKL